MNFYELEKNQECFLFLRKSDSEVSCFIVGWLQGARLSNTAPASLVYSKHFSTCWLHTHLAPCAGMDPMKWQSLISWLLRAC